MKKAVVIGSGLGGLKCGVILSKEGYNVTVLEKEIQAGRCTRCSAISTFWTCPG